MYMSVRVAICWYLLIYIYIYIYTHTCEHTLALTHVVWQNHTWVSKLESSSHLFLFIFSILSDFLFDLVRLAFSTFPIFTSCHMYVANECAVFVGQHTHSSYLPLRWSPGVCLVLSLSFMMVHTHRAASVSNMLTRCACSNIKHALYTFQHSQIALMTWRCEEITRDCTFQHRPTSLTTWSCRKSITRSCISYVACVLSCLCGACMRAGEFRETGGWNVMNTHAKRSQTIGDACPRFSWCTHEWGTVKCEVDAQRVHNRRRSLYASSSLFWFPNMGVRRSERQPPPPPYRCLFKAESFTGKAAATLSLMLHVGERTSRMMLSFSNASCIAHVCCCHSSTPVVTCMNLCISPYIYI